MKSGYVVEKKLKNSDKWERVHEFVGGTSCAINKLKEGQEYEFRVIAENQFGLGEPLVTEKPVLAKNPFGRIADYLFKKIIFAY